MPTKSLNTDKTTTTKIRKSVLPKSNEAFEAKTPNPTPSPAVSTTAAANPVISQEEREQMIRETAYYLSEKDGFTPGKDEEYWRQAEEQIDKMLKA